MDSNGLSLLISKNSFYLALALIVGIFIYYFYVKPKMTKDKIADVHDTKESSTIKDNEKDTVFKRMGRGFRVMHEKIYNSEIVKNIQESNEKTDNSEFMPKELFVPAELEDDISNRKKKKKEKKYNYQWSTDFSNLNNHEI